MSTDRHVEMNVFRLLGDFSHVLSFFILFYKIFKTRCTKGISCKMYLLFVLVFTTRYLDVVQYFISVYNTVMKLSLITMSCIMVYLIHVKFPRQEKKVVDSFRIQFLIIPALILALFVNHSFDIMEVLWAFSIFLEAVAILPQLFLVWKTGEVDIYTCSSVFALAAYRGYYILNWIYRYVNEYHYDLISVGAGVIQTVLYCRTAAMMSSKYQKDNQESKLADLDSFQDGLACKLPEGRDVLEDKTMLADNMTVAGYDVIKLSSKVNHPVPVCCETDLLNIQNHINKDESLPQVFLQKKREENKHIPV